MPYQPYYPGGWQPGPGGGTPITADALNHMETQYHAVSAETTRPGGTEPNRRARTGAAGAVGLARALVTGPVRVDIFTASGTWVKPSGAKVVYVQVISGGG